MNLKALTWFVELVRHGSAIFILVLRLVDMSIYTSLPLSLSGILFRFFVGFPSMSEALYGASHSQMDRHASPQRLPAATVAAPRSQNERRPEKKGPWMATNRQLNVTLRIIIVELNQTCDNMGYIINYIIIWDLTWSNNQSFPPFIWSGRLLNRMPQEPWWM